MHAQQFAKLDALTIGPLTLTNRAIKCGDPSCTKCPHGGQWYARIPAGKSTTGAKADVYLGPHWDKDDLFHKVALKLNAPHREDFVGEIGKRLDLERLTEVGKLISSRTIDLAANNADRRKRLDDIDAIETRSIKDAKRSASHARQQEKQRHTRAKQRITKELRDLKREQRTIADRLKQAKKG